MITLHLKHIYFNLCQCREIDVKFRASMLELNEHTFSIFLLPQVQLHSQIASQRQAENPTEKHIYCIQINLRRLTNL